MTLKSRDTLKTGHVRQKSASTLNIPRKKMLSSHHHTYIYKILPEIPEQPLPVVYPLSKLDKTDGFVHLSTADQVRPPSLRARRVTTKALLMETQVPRTADMFFSDVMELWFIKIRTKQLLQHRIEWGPTGCVSLYGHFGAGDIAAVEKWERKESLWSESLKNTQWLE